MSELNEEGLDPSRPLTASGNLRRRMIVNRIAVSGATVAAAFAIFVLVAMVYTVVNNGGSAISWSFLTTAGSAFGPAGIGPAIVGTALIAAFATAIAAPVGILIALYMTQYARPGRFSNSIRLVLDLLNGMPSMVVAIFVFGLLVAGNHESGFAMSVALAIIMLPLIARSSQEVLRLVPQGMLDAADALGVSRWRKIVTVLLPSAMGGLLTSTVLAVARAAGETAPAIVLNAIFAPQFQTNIFGQTVPNIPMEIFTLSESGSTGYSEAWGAALVLLAAILFANIVSRWALARSQRKLFG